MKKTFSIIFFATLSNMSVLSITTGLSCLYNPHTKMKIAILYDQHYEQFALKSETMKPLLKTQKTELEQLVDTLSQTKQDPVFFIIECDPVMKEDILRIKENGILPILFVIPQIFFKQETTILGNITFECADPRSRIERSVATNFVADFDEVFKLFNERNLVDWATEISIDSYLEYLKTRKAKIFKDIEALNIIGAHAKENAKKSVNTTYSKIVSFINKRMNTYNIKQSDHLLELYHPLIKKENNYYLFSRIVDWGNAMFDIQLLILLEKVQKEYSTGSIVVVQAGQLHAKLLEHRLLQYGFILRAHYGVTEDFIIDEDEIVHPKIPVKKEDFDIALGLRSINTLIIDNCISTNWWTNLWDTIKRWLGYN